MFVLCECSESKPAKFPELDDMNGTSVNEQSQYRRGLEGFYGGWLKCVIYGCTFVSVCNRLIIMQTEGFLGTQLKQTGLYAMP